MDRLFRFGLGTAIDPDVRRPGRRVITSALVTLLVARAFVKMLSKQIYLKATKLSRKTGSVEQAPAKIATAAAFVWSMCQYNREVIRRCRQCLTLLAARGVTEVAVYGANDVATLLCYLTLEIPIRVGGVYDDFPPERFLSYRVLPARACADVDSKVIVAALVGLDDQVERLVAAGTKSDRIVLLRHDGILGPTVVYDRDLAAAADQSSSSSCESAV